MIAEFEITESTTREDLISRISDLDEEISKLEAEIENLSLFPAQRERLVEAADLMADAGRIHNTPIAKADWIAGA